jgi:hypothetical protein
MSAPSCELKLRTLALGNAALVTALSFTAGNGQQVFSWFDRQLAQGDIGAPADNRTCVMVQRVSTARQPYYNQGGITPLSTPRLQITVIDYNAERARQVAALVSQFMATISLCDAGEFSSPVTSPSQNPNFLLNERAGMLPQLSPPAYTEIQDWRVFNREDLPAN